MKKFNLLALMIAQLMLMSPVRAGNVAPAKAAELSLHRLERLVFLKKINETLMSKFRSLNLEVLLPPTPEDPSYRAIAKEYPAADGLQDALTIYLDENGKAMKNEVSAAASADNTPQWPDKDPVTLAENSLHFVLEEGEKGTAEIVPFFASFASLEISQVTEGDGSIRAHIKMFSRISGKKLLVVMNADGTLNSHQILD